MVPRVDFAQFALVVANSGMLWWCCYAPQAMLRMDEVEEEKGKARKGKEEYTLKDWEIQQLVEDIEKEGGRKRDTGKYIYDKRESVYGAQGSAKRKAFRNFKNNLRRQTIQTYWKETIIGRQVQPTY